MSTWKIGEIVLCKADDIRMSITKEDKASWVSFFPCLRERGLDGVKLVIEDKAP